MTNNPDRRFAEHQNNAKQKYSGDHWDHMFVLYRTKSLDRAHKVESDLIKYAKQHYPGITMNDVNGRVSEGRSPFSYVYFLREWKKK